MGPRARGTGGHRRSPPPPRPYTLRALARTLGVDTGGTFTDLVLSTGRGRRVVKLPSTPADPGAALVAGLERLGGARDGDHVVHGTTVALNALLTGDLARVALVTGQGFADVIEVGRQARPDIYALEPERPRPLVPRHLRFEVPSRAWPRLEGEGLETVAEPDARDLERLLRNLRRAEPQAAAICLLHSWADSSGERALADALAPLAIPITCSAELLPEHREVERFSTALVNAALVPRMRTYLGELARRIEPARLSLLQSTGGSLPAERAAEEPVRVLFSGPAGGVVGAANAAAEAGFDEVVTLDMGGTSADVAFHSTGGDSEGAGLRTGPRVVAGHPIAVPALDIHTIGCGGGSLVGVDAGGVLHVGPHSAGADPGPVAYGRSDVPTVTDAHVLLGHVAEGPFLEGRLALDHAGVQRAFDELGRRLATSAEDAAQAVLDVARAAMRRAIGVMTMQRGKDPRALPLVAFGGAGGLHAADLAASLGMEAALVPADPGALSARGMVESEARLDLAHAVLAPLAHWTRERREEVRRELERSARAELVGGGARERAVRVECVLDLRYRGQSYELEIPDGPQLTDPVEAFHAAHERYYGHRLDGREIELVCLRVRARVPRSRPRVSAVRERPLRSGSESGHRPVRFASGRRPVRTPVLSRDVLEPGHLVEGPAVVEEYSGTTLVPPGASVLVASGGHLVLRPGDRTRRRRKA